jgi:hypothetical protein
MLTFFIASKTNVIQTLYAGHTQEALGGQCLTQKTPEVYQGLVRV